MKPALTNKPVRRGATLVEAVIAIGVLAVAIPLVFGTMAESGKTIVSSEAETRSSWIVPACLREIQASREGRPQYFTATKTGESFPKAGDVWALAFSPDGKPIGRLSMTLYDKGTKELDGKTVRYIASMTAGTPKVQSGSTPMLLLQISMEFPAAAKARKRRKLDFHTQIP